MTTAPVLPRTEQARAAADQPRCSVCDHDLADHDPISRRYCQATQANALPRNCICRVPSA